MPPDAFEDSSIPQYDQEQDCSQLGHPQNSLPCFQYGLSLPEWGRFEARKVEVGKVYFVPYAHSVPATSIIHKQKRQDGFFNHPCLVVGLVQDKWAVFYALSSKPPRAIEELKMFLTMGTTSEEKGPSTLSLARDSPSMSGRTIINLEQLYRIEKGYLCDWSVDVRIAPCELVKINTRVHQLEAEQNRFIYKPIGRDLSSAGPGTVLMLPNYNGASTFGGPVLVVQNDGSRIRYLRIKRVQDNQALQQPLNPTTAYQRSKCLLMKKELCYGHDRTPVLLFKQGSPEMREPSYVEVTKKMPSRALDDMKTWCFPHVQLAHHSVKVLFQYISNFQESRFVALRHNTLHLTNGVNAHRRQVQGNSFQHPLQPIVNYSRAPRETRIAAQYSPHRAHCRFSYHAQHAHASLHSGSPPIHNALFQNPQHTMYTPFRGPEMALSPMNVHMVENQAYASFEPQGIVQPNINNEAIETKTEYAREPPTITRIYEQLTRPTSERDGMGE